MFEALKGMAGLSGIMKDLPRIRQRLEEVKGELAERTVEAAVGGGAVRAVADGRLRIREVHIDPAMLGAIADSGDDGDRQLAEDLVAGAVNAALEKAQEMVTARLAEVAKELGLPMPPGGLAGLLS
ncbi:MAG: YbaB/EbfC family nucleoid-associated protein [Phycisphaerales bacterium]|nr:YbaB/EbfC family nucleoid-associated protein [Phycisphaerales bacterium]